MGANSTSGVLGKVGEGVSLKGESRGAYEGQACLWIGVLKIICVLRDTLSQFPSISASELPNELQEMYFPSLRDAFKNEE